MQALFSERCMLLLMIAIKLLLAAAVVWNCRAQQVLPPTGILTPPSL
jgi:hypothetical protein